MSTLVARKANIPSKVHYTEYIIAENEPKERVHATSPRTTPHRRTAFMRAMAWAFHV